MVTFTHDPVQQLNVLCSSSRAHHQRLEVNGDDVERGMHALVREQVENLLHTALASLSGEVSGAYERLSDMDPDDEDALAREGLMLEKPEPGSLAVACGAAREWPDHRGVFRDEDSSVVCWVNGPEDHCTLWVMQRDHDVFAAFRKLCLLHQV